MIKIKFMLILACLVFGVAVHAQRKAVFVILDGIPADVIEKLETPVLDQIAQKDGYARAYLGGAKGGYSESPTISAVGYNHLLTGTWTHKHNVWDNDIKAPNYNYWNLFRIAETVNPALKTAVFSSWTDNRTKLVGEGLPEAGGIKLDYSYDGLELDTVRFPHTKDSKHMFNIDEQVSTEAGRYILDNGPDLSWVYLEFTDDMGHMYGDSPQFYDAVKKADAQVGRIWSAIQARTQKFGEEWMIVVTTDHGRDVKTGKHHGGQSDRERTTWIVTNAKPLNAHFKETPATVDIAPSILAFMRLKAPEATIREFDGVSFVDNISASNLKAVRQGDKVTLTWTAHDRSGEAEILISTTNEFASGGTDNYQRIGKTSVAGGTYSFTIPAPASADVCKIVVKTPRNTVTTWAVKEGYRKTADKTAKN